MSSSLDLFLRRLRDPRWIPHISDYCDHRCERCAFSAFEYNRHEDFRFETDAIQTDANGSAKVARLAITSSLAAWAAVESAGLLDPGLVTYLTANLKKIESELAERFPLAMAFVRPGFDEEIPGIVRPWSIMPDEDDEEKSTED